MSWSISATSVDFDRLRESEAFAEALTLGRVANLLRACLASAVVDVASDNTRQQRARIAATLLLTGLIAEAIPVLKRSGKHFRHLPGFGKTVTPLLRDPELVRLRQKWFEPLRNRAVFHNDVVVSTSGLRLMRPGVPQNLACGSSSRSIDTYYPVADVVAMMYVIQTAGATENPSTFLSDALGKVVEVAWELCAAIDTVLGQALEEWGFVLDESQ